MDINGNWTERVLEHVPRQGAEGASKSSAAATMLTRGIDQALNAIMLVLIVSIITRNSSQATTSLCLHTPEPFRPSAVVNLTCCWPC
jgi:hypothetical protein